MLLCQKCSNEEDKSIAAGDESGSVLKLLHDNLQKASSRYRFHFCIVDMREIEQRFRSFDSSLMNVLSDAEKSYLDTLKLDKNKVQFISGRYAVKDALFKYKAMSSNLMDLSCIDVLKGASSAPYVLQYPSVKVSITHTHPYCIGIIAEDRIGIDIEKIFEPEQALIRYFYCENEKTRLESYFGSKDYSVQAIIMWTRKEAVSKLLGLGMSMDFRSIDTSADEIYISGCCKKPLKAVSYICKEFCVSLALENSLF